MDVETNENTPLFNVAADVESYAACGAYQNAAATTEDDDDELLATLWWTCTE